MTDNAAYGTHYSDAEGYMEYAHSFDFNDDQTRALMALGFAQVNAQLAIVDALEKLIDAYMQAQCHDRYLLTETDPLDEGETR